MSWNRRGSSRILTAAVAAMLAPAAVAATPDTSEWKCERCPFAKGYQAEFTAGSTYVSDDAVTVGDATGYDEKGAYLNADGAGLFAADGHRLRWSAEDLGLDSRALDIAGGRPGSFDYRLSYRQLPQRRFDATRTVFSRAPDGLLVLPPAWTFAGTTTGMTALAASLVPQDIGGDREILGIGGRVQATARLRAFADLQREEHDGARMLGAPYFTSASLLPHRFDYRTDQVDAGIRYDGDRGHLKFAYHGSFFDSSASAIAWQSPFTTAPGAESGALAEAPDNDFQQLALTGSYRMPWLDTRMSFTAAMGRGTQDETLLPYTTNAGLVTAPLPRPSLDAKVDTTHLAVTVLSRPLPKTRVKFAIRYDERDNRTPQYAWSRVVADTFLSGESELNVPYGYERLRMNLSADYDFSGSLSASAGYDFTDVDRRFQEVGEQNEDSGWGRVRWRPNGWLDIAAKGGISRREIDGYDTALAAGFGQNPLLRKFNLAYRYREFGELSVSATLPDKPVSLGARALYADDSYSSTPLGVTGSEERHVAFDLNWSMSDRATVYLVAGYDEVDTRQRGSGAFSPVPDWNARQADEFYSAGGGLRITGIAEKLDLQLDYSHARGTTAIDVTGGIGPAAFPDLETTLDSFRARLAWRWSEKLEAILQLRYERLPTEDWALQGIGPGTLPAVLTLGAAPYDDEAWLAGISFRYRLGGE
ncbi:MAG: MtrB/PioB family decaheme-associated outer membrane protein [Steroidobacteraceae bacterium]|nr:MtrB/PioB family decaheme-associated outer membrane protein [Steroidobacteraceae bacterium]